MIPREARRWLKALLQNEVAYHEQQHSFACFLAQSCFTEVITNFNFFYWEEGYFYRLPLTSKSSAHQVLHCCLYLHWFSRVAITKCYILDGFIRQIVIVPHSGG